MKTISVHLFAAIRDAASSDTIELEVNESSTADDMICLLCDRLPSAADLLSVCRVAVDGCYVPGNVLIADAAELAIIPPVSGG